MSPAPFVPALFASFVAWRVYRRFRRSIGRQPLHPRRMITSIILLSAASLLVIIVSQHHLTALLGFGGGWLAGVLLALIGLRLTRFETTGTVHFYTPNTHIGVALSLLFIGRLVYRFMVLRTLSTASQPSPAIAQSPLTLLIFGLLAGYYIAYYAGVFAHSRGGNDTCKKNS